MTLLGSRLVGRRGHRDGGGRFCVGLWGRFGGRPLGTRTWRGCSLGGWWGWSRVGRPCRYRLGRLVRLGLHWWR